MKINKKYSEGQARICIPSEAGKILGLTSHRVRQLETEGKLVALRSLTGRRVFLVDGVLALARRRAAARKARGRK